MTKGKLRPPGWTAREALACAYCWAAFACPQDREDTPEGYWLSISEQARNWYRDGVDKLFLLSVIQREAVAVPPVHSLGTPKIKELATALNMKAEHRVRKILTAVLMTFKTATL